MTHINKRVPALQMKFKLAPNTPTFWIDLQLSTPKPGAGVHETRHVAAPTLVRDVNRHWRWRAHNGILPFSLGCLVAFFGCLEYLLVNAFCQHHAGDVILEFTYPSICTSPRAKPRRVTTRRFLGSTAPTATSGVLTIAMILGRAVGIAARP